MDLIDLCSLGYDEIKAKYDRGDLKPSHLWVAAVGAKEYREAVAKGDIAGEADQAARLKRCLTCPSRKERTKPEVETVTIWCGPPLEDHTQTAMPTCGCLVGIRVGGKTLPGGRTSVASKECVQGRWRACERAI